MVVVLLLLLLLLLLGAEEATASNSEVRLLLVLAVDILNGFFSFLLLRLLVLWLLDPESELSQEADFSSKAAAGLAPLPFLLRFLSSLIGVTGTEDEEDNLTSTTSGSSRVTADVTGTDLTSLSSQPISTEVSSSSTFSISVRLSLMFGLTLFLFSLTTEVFERVGDCSVGFSSTFCRG